MKHETIPVNFALRRERDFMPINPKLIQAGLPPWAATEPNGAEIERPKFISAWRRGEIQQAPQTEDE